jgi:hypothetical protein
MEKKKSNIYLLPEDLLKEFHKSKELGKPTDTLIIYFQKIAKNFVKTFHNKNKCDDDACINFAVAEAWLKWEKYDENRCNNIFSFYTTIIGNDMILHYNKLTKGKKTAISIESLFSNTEK